MTAPARFFTWLKHRWDVTPDERSVLSFREILALINLRRAELACLLAFGNDVIALGLGLRYGGIVLEVALLPVFLVIATVARRRGSVRAQQIAVALMILASMLITQIVVAQIVASTGRITSAFPNRLLTTALLFVLPPRTWATLLVINIASYAAMIVTLPLSTAVQIDTLAHAVILTAICLVTGWLIHASRQSDHQQKAQIEAQNTRLAAQNAELDQLMAIAAHDLRSPLHGLRSLFDLAARRAAQDPALPLRVLRDGIVSLDEMLALVNRLLQAHQAEHGPLAAVVEGDLREQLRVAARRIAPLAEAQAVTVGLTLPEAPLHARFDAGALAQILDNLLGNAVRFTPAGQALRLRASAAAGHAVLTVEDCGPGIAPALRSALFGKFQRGIHAQSDAGTGMGGKTGAGMGLFIAATYATRIGATLSYRPAEPGGSIFELSLPLAAASPARPNPSTIGSQPLAGR